MTLHHGDCLAILPTLDAESVDAIVTDPPYDLTSGKRGGSGVASVNLDSPYGRARIGTGNGGGFMGKGWDATGIAFRPETWAECYRVAKPGAYLLAFGGTRTVHRMVCAIEDAGWEIRDMLVWGYASGFPKSHNLTGERQGWGTALKPAWEPIVMARKPLRGTVAENVAEYGTGAMNIDGCRIGSEPMPHVPGELGARNIYGRMTRKDRSAWTTPDAAGDSQSGTTSSPVDAQPSQPSTSTRLADMPGRNASAPPHTPVPATTDPHPRGTSSGRWPANILLSDPIFDGDTPGVVGGGETSIAPPGRWTEDHQTAALFSGLAGTTVYGDSGTYSRFFLIPKAARADREPVMGGIAERVISVWGGDEDDLTPGKKSTVARRNVHPTVKPTDLMRHLVRLVTPPGGVVLDPFLGSGTTALAAEMEGFGWIGIEREAEYVAIAEARLNGTQKGMGLAG